MNNAALSESLLRQVEFLKEVEKLKLVNRKNRVFGGARFENSAEHSWHVALMAVILGQYVEEDIDLLKVIKMLLIHDLVEIDAGDTWLYSPDADAAFQEEEIAANRLFAILPLEQQTEFTALWREFQTKTTAEAKFVSAIDGVQPLLNHLVTGNPSEGVISLETGRAKKEYIRSSAPKLWKLVENLIALSVEKGLYRQKNR